MERMEYLKTLKAVIDAFEKYERVENPSYVYDKKTADEFRVYAISRLKEYFKKIAAGGSEVDKKILMVLNAIMRRVNELDTQKVEPEDGASLTLCASDFDPNASWEENAKKGKWVTRWER